MKMYLEFDEESYLRHWDNLEGSGEEEIFEDREVMELDEDKEDHFEKSVKYLEGIAPHIRWRIDYEIGPYGVPDSSMGRIICVPDSQYDEAKYILERYKAGDKYTSYSYKDKYPEIYVTINGEKQLQPDVANFIKLSEKYVDLLDPTGHDDIVQVLTELRELLPHLYYAGTRLPRIANAKDYYEDYTQNFDLDFGEHDSFFCIDNPYIKEPAEESLSGCLDWIAKDIEPGLIAFSEGNIDRIAAATDDWRITFGGSVGWGQALLKELTAIHFAIDRIWKDDLEKKMEDLRLKK